MKELEADDDNATLCLERNTTGVTKCFNGLGKDEWLNLDHLVTNCTVNQMFESKLWKRREHVLREFHLWSKSKERTSVECLKYRDV